MVEHYALLATWRWIGTLHLYGPDGQTTRCGRPAVAYVRASTVASKHGADPAQWPVCGSCLRSAPGVQGAIRQEA